MIQMTVTNTGPAGAMTSAMAMPIRPRTPPMMPYTIIELTRCAIAGRRSRP
jgi:hypothetical protein